MFSAVFWSILLPSVVVIGATVTANGGMLVLLPAAWAAQILRIAAKRAERGGLYYRLKAAGVTMISKLAEATGILRFWLSRAGDHPANYRDAGLPTRIEPV
jgi:hypothetical protein